MTRKKPEVIFTFSVNDKNFKDVMSSYRGLEVIVEYYDHRIDTFNREVSHWFKPTFGTSSFSTAIINFVKKEYPEIDAENIEVNPILDELPFDNGDYNTLGLLQISGLTICDWKKIATNVQIDTLSAWHGTEDEIVLHFSREVPGEIMQYVKNLHGWTSYTGITVSALDEGIVEKYGLLSYIDN
ncbi:hypothetical protein FMK62_27090 [Klebsiella grimontii]|nr:MULTISPECIES: hypothetical protein [Klebsiella/Raoultella group]MBZ6572340.1 hypothetical protein [Klebsiella grimontii]MBZ7216655.1 hypothetical protein [Klebsiella grimontii]MBZ7379280.1 hypothetical protein [Klebsiella grimontii]MCG8665086.1 hypothetical protein [Klebsiella michiganensis]VTN01900.1 Uncharacterised protein [Raoultella planticola]